MEKDLISIVVPVYKVEQFLDCCLQSIVSQTYKNLEIILVDDGSPDNCPKMCDDWSKRDKRIRVIHKQNGGLSSARNAGLKVFSGNFVCFVDSDDFLEPNYVKAMLCKQKETNADLVFCKLNRFNNGKTEKCEEDLKSITQNYNVESIYEAACNKTFMLSVCKVLYRRELIKDLRFNEDVKYSEDISFTMLVSSKEPTLAYVDEYLYNYRQNVGSITNLKSKSSAENYLNSKFLDEQLMLKLKLFDVAKSMAFDKHIHISLFYSNFTDLFNQTKQFNTKENYLAYKKYHKIKRDRLKAFLVYHKMYWLINLIQKIRKK